MDTKGVQEAPASSLCAHINWFGILLQYNNKHTKFHCNPLRFALPPPSKVDTPSTCRQIKFVVEDPPWLIGKVSLSRSTFSLGKLP